MGKFSTRSQQVIQLQSSKHQNVMYVLGSYQSVRRDLNCLRRSGSCVIILLTNISDTNLLIIQNHIITKNMSVTFIMTSHKGSHPHILQPLQVTVC